MDDWEELEIEREDDALPAPAERRTLLPWLIWGVLALSLVLVAGYYVSREPKEPPAGEPPIASRPERPGREPVDLEPPGAPEASEAPEEEPIELPPLSASDVLVRETASRLSSHPELASFLLTDELVRRFVVSVVNVAEGESPRRQLRHVRPEERFSVMRRGGRLYVDPVSYRRYDLHAEVFDSLDPEGVARLLGLIDPLLQEAYLELGLPEGAGFESALARAVAVLRETPVVEGPIALRVANVNYAYASSELEALSPAQKHLVRMGPENTRRVQAKLAEIAEALGL